MKLYKYRTIRHAEGTRRIYFNLGDQIDVRFITNISM